MSLTPLEQPTHPRCATCRWSIENVQPTAADRRFTDGECTRHSKGRSGTPFWTEGIQEPDGEGEWRRRFAGLYTERDFYCIAWETEEGGATVASSLWGDLARLLGQVRWDDADACDLAAKVLEDHVPFDVLAQAMSREQKDRSRRMAREILDSHRRMIETEAVPYGEEEE